MIKKKNLLKIAILFFVFYVMLGMRDYCNAETYEITMEDIKSKFPASWGNVEINSVKWEDGTLNIPKKVERSTSVSSFKGEINYTVNVAGVKQTKTIEETFTIPAGSAESPKEEKSDDSKKKVESDTSGKKEQETKQKDVYTEKGLEDVIKGADNFLASGKEQVDEEELKNASNSLVNLFIAAGTILAVVYIGILGIKYMLGAAEEKAEIKETLVPFIIGCVVIFGAFTFWKIAIIIGSNLSL